VAERHRDEAERQCARALEALAEVRRLTGEPEVPRTEERDTPMDQRD
jgi:hypothetical protein